MSASQNFDTAGVLAATLVIMALGLVLMWLGHAIERRFARWRV
jgi:ABC-type nitrate/sulfonate/bicarbonate transport system permease component